MHLPSLGWGLGIVRRTATKQQRRRTPVTRLAVAVEICEPRVLLSATAIDADHCRELVDAHGNEYDALPLPDDALAPEMTGDFDGTGNLEALSQTFLLHSNPNATHTIYLDFDGHLTSGTVWNSSFTGGADFFTPAYDFEGGTSVFTDNELTRIQLIWQRVAEDFLPFNVDVTTEDPGAAALSKSGSGDTAWGVRVVIGGNGSWYGSAGGVAYVGSFNWSSDTPVFAFSDMLADAEKYVAEAVSHEAGHALGLSHDGASGTTYYQGSGSGETGWAPIMGNSYYQNVTQWSRGEYPGANNTQDDLAIITSQNGFGYRADDYGNSNATAGSLVVAGTTATGSGIIEIRTDVDVHAFATGAGTISFDVSGVYRGNLDILAELYDANGNLVVSANPTDRLGASFSVTVGAGIYYLHVDGVGKGDPLTGGYSDYASLGGYLISGTIVETSGSFPSYYSIAAQDADAAEGNSGQTAFTFVVSRTGDTSASGSVNYAVAGSGANAANGADFSGGFASGTVMFAAGESSKTITLYVQGDLSIEADEEFVVSLSNPSSGGEITAGQAFGTIRNDDQPGIVVSPTSGLSVDESGGTAAFSVVLTHQPTADVHIVVTSDDTTEGTVSVGELVFTAANWNVAQTVTVTGVDDGERDGNQNFTILLGPVTSGDAFYDGLDTDDVSVTCRDDDKGVKGGGGTGDGSDTRGNNGNGKGGGPKGAALILLTDDGADRGESAGSTTVTTGPASFALPSRIARQGAQSRVDVAPPTSAAPAALAVETLAAGGTAETSWRDDLHFDMDAGAESPEIDALFAEFDELETALLAV